MNYTLLTNSKIIELISSNDEFPELLEIYNKLKPLAFKSDIIRLYALYKTGGIYLDVDFICYQTTEDLYNQYDLTVVKNIDSNSICNAFICCKKGNLFIKTLLLQIIENVKTKIPILHDLELTGPIIFGNVFSKYYNIPIPFSEAGLGRQPLSNSSEKIKIITYSFNFPLPKGGYLDSVKNAVVTNGNMLNVDCFDYYGNLVKNIISFVIGDSLENDNGKIVYNTKYDYKETAGSGLIFSESDNIFYAISKYPNFDNEKILLNGNDYIQLFKNNNIYN